VIVRFPLSIGLWYGNVDVSARLQLKPSAEVGKTAALEVWILMDGRIEFNSFVTALLRGQLFGDSGVCVMCLRRSSRK